MKKSLGIALLALLVSAACQAAGNERPKTDLRAMHGYVKQYEGCSAIWKDGSQSLTLTGEKCATLSQDVVLDDAAKAYLDMRSKSNAANFSDYYTEIEAAKVRYTEPEAALAALSIWKAGCSDFKNGMNAGNFQGWLRLGDTEKAYPGIRKIAVTRLYMDGWDMARNLNGIVNCADMAISRVDDYMSGIDIRT